MLMLKDKDEMNGIESYVLERYVQNELSWFPVGKALSLNVDALEEEAEDKVESIQEKVDYAIGELEKRHTMLTREFEGKGKK